LQIAKIEAFGERLEGLSQAVAGTRRQALSLPETGKTHDGPELEDPRTLLVGQRDGFLEAGARRRLVVSVPPQQGLPFNPCELGLIDALLACGRPRARFGYDRERLFGTTDARQHSPELCKVGQAQLHSGGPIHASTLPHPC